MGALAAMIPGLASMAMGDGSDAAKVPTGGGGLPMGGPGMDATGQPAQIPQSQGSAQGQDYFMNVLRELMMQGVRK